MLMWQAIGSQPIRRGFEAEDVMPERRRPRCTACGTRTALARISPIELVHELRTFECCGCGQVDRYAVKTGPDSYWLLLSDSGGAPARADSSAR